ncbi:hypothetical protein BU24DRAFT_49757 [Aaosphaeria arxii CBS 175.79]|uniref:Uncharacterized protein n=1 Tax=Aaosphaeria arxii CBS 175.79 TaxID=1450172 RepID=A0A6A5XDK3_9PLEO|nr:uncharacterized protein BU24DRAFT_49757 [Aaosphaeria arxii CBS 175.79]KAF2010961.1 hypothetical protein BU24DRAFT_49757 [Aaosphaeria arxii CBS 175.79]
MAVLWLGLWLSWGVVVKYANGMVQLSEPENRNVKEEGSDNDQRTATRLLTDSFMSIARSLRGPAKTRQAVSGWVGHVMCSHLTPILSIIKPRRFTGLSRLLSSGRNSATLKGLPPFHFEEFLGFCEAILTETKPTLQKSHLANHLQVDELVPNRTF